jgi:hypothetical protein
MLPSGPFKNPVGGSHGIYTFRQLINIEIEKINDWLNEKDWDYMNPKTWPYQAELADNAKVSGKQEDQDAFEEYKAWVKGEIDPDEYSQAESDRSKGVRKPSEE